MTKHLAEMKERAERVEKVLPGGLAREVLKLIKALEKCREYLDRVSLFETEQEIAALDAELTAILEGE